MNASWRIGSLFGIAIRIHATFPLLLIWIATIQYAERKLWSDVAAGLGFAIAILCIVVLHELGHALTARKFKIRTRDITLLPIGGVARLERMPTNPVQELWIALAGPAVNVALAVLRRSAMNESPHLTPTERKRSDGEHCLHRRHLWRLPTTS